MNEGQRCLAWVGFCESILGMEMGWIWLDRIGYGCMGKPHYSMQDMLGSH